MRGKTRLTFVLFASAFSSLAPMAGASGQTDPRVDALFADLDRADGPGAAVLVVRDGAVTYRNAFGQADLEHGIPITTTTVFDIASVSKQFAGMSIAMLAESGEIDLAEDIRTYMPELPSFEHVITVDHLVHHTSGLRDWPGTLAVAGWRMDDVISFDQILRMARTQEDLNFRPGSQYSYSNTGYNVLAALVARRSGQSFRAWTDENLFAPLGMTDTHFHDDHQEVVADRAQGYTPVGDGFRRIPNGLTALGSSSLYTTVEDLAEWMMNFDAPRVGGAPVIERMRARGVLNNDREIPYAFGQSRGEYRGAETWSHTGSWAGFRTVLTRVPEHDFGVVILSNLASYNPGPVANQVIDILLDDVLEPVEQAEHEADEEEVGGEEVELEPAVMDELVGTYRLGPRVILISRGGNGLMTEIIGDGRFPMTPTSGSEFFVPAYRTSLSFGRSEAGDVDHVMFRGFRAPRADVPSGGFETYEGEFYSRELDTSYRLTVRDGALIAHHRRHGDIELTTILEDRFRGNVWFIPDLQIDRGDDGAVSGFRITQGRSRNLRFERRGG